MLYHVFIQRNYLLFLFCFVCFFALVLLSCTECPDIKCRQKSHKYTKACHETVNENIYVYCCMFYMLKSYQYNVEWKNFSYRLPKNSMSGIITIKRDKNYCSMGTNILYIELFFLFLFSYQIILKKTSFNIILKDLKKADCFCSCENIQEHDCLFTVYIFTPPPQ